MKELLTYIVQSLVIRVLMKAVAQRQGKKVSVEILD